MEVQDSNTNKPIIIVGAGPAGLVLAYMLVSSGMKVTVFERHKDFDRDFRGEFLQPSGMRILESLGLIQDLDQTGGVLPVSGVQMHYRNSMVSSTKTIDGLPAGFLVHQPTLLEALSARCKRFSTFTLHMDTAVTGFSKTHSEVDGVAVRTKDGTETVHAGFVVVCNGRMSSLRDQLNLPAKVKEPPYSIMWHRFDMTEYLNFMPNDLNGFVGPKGLCVVFPTHGNKIQVMWRRRPEYPVDWKLPKEKLGRVLLSDLTPHWRSVVERVIDKPVERQLLKVVSDNMDKWYTKNVLFIGDAAHSMSPIGGQGLAMAIRDATVTANHFCETFEKGLPLDEILCATIQEERTFEITEVQKFQAKAASLHVAAPPMQWFIAKIIIPLVTWIRGKSYMDALQYGFSTVEPKTKSITPKKPTHEYTSV